MGMIWKQIPDYPMYEVSSHGYVRRGNFVLNPQITKKGYSRVTLYKDRKGKSFVVHRLVLWAFTGVYLKLHGAHINGMKTDNRLSNLKWATAKENEMDKEIHGKRAKGERNGYAKLSENDVREIRKRYKITKRPRWSNSKDLAKEFNVSQQHIMAIIRRDLWRMDEIAKGDG